MFKRWNTQPRAWLLVRPPACAGEAWEWLHCAAGQAQVSGFWPPPADCLCLPAALVIPAMQCSHFQVAAPPGLKRHEWPQLIEESVQQPAESLLVSCLSREDGQLELLVVEREPLQRWLAECAQLGLAIERGWAELQLLPQPAEGHVIRWEREQDLFLKGGRGQWLVWPGMLGEALPVAWHDLPVERLEGRWPSRLAALERLPSVLDGPRSARSPAHRYLKLTAVQRRLLGGCALLAACWGGIYAVQMWQMIELWKAQVTALTGPLDTPRQARGALARLQGSEADWHVRQQQVVMLEQDVAQWLGSRSGWAVSSYRFDGRVWSLGLRGSGALPAPEEWQTIALRAGAEMSVEPAAGGLGVNFDLGPAS